MVTCKSTCCSPSYRSLLAARRSPFAVRRRRRAAPGPESQGPRSKFEVRISNRAPSTEHRELRTRNFGPRVGKFEIRTNASRPCAHLFSRCEAGRETRKTFALARPGFSNLLACHSQSLWPASRQPDRTGPDRPDWPDQAWPAGRSQRQHHAKQPMAL